MKKHNMYHDTQRAWVYRENYRPSSNLYRLIKTVMSVVLEGHSPAGGHPNYPMRKKR